MTNYYVVHDDMDFYFNTFPTLIAECSHQGTFISECVFGLKGVVGHQFPPWAGAKFWKRYHKIHQAYLKLPTRYQKALALLYDNTYLFRPGTEIGDLWEENEKLYGKTTKLLIMQTQIAEVRELRRLHRHKRQRSMTAEHKKVMFILGEEIRNLYEGSHNAYLSYKH